MCIFFLSGACVSVLFFTYLFRLRQWELGNTYDCRLGRGDFPLFLVFWRGGGRKEGCSGCLGFFFWLLRWFLAVDVKLLWRQRPRGCVVQGAVLCLCVCVLGVGSLQAAGCFSSFISAGGKGEGRERKRTDRETTKRVTLAKVNGALEIPKSSTLRHEPPGAIRLDVMRRKGIVGKHEAVVMTLVDGLLRLVGKEKVEEVNFYETQFKRGWRKGEVKFRNRSKRWSVILDSEVERGKLLETLKKVYAWKFEKNYWVGDKLGEGAYAVVYKCSPLNNKSEMFACKVMDLSNLTDSERSVVTNEVNILLEANGHESVVSAIDVFRTVSTVHIVMEFLQDGDLFDYISSRSEPVPEPVAKHVMRQLFKALQHLHARNIAHRDLKPENILLSDLDTGMPTIKVTDFGLAGRLNDNANIGAVDDEELERFEYGTVGYMAPEIVLRKRHHTAVDMWACGCILYVLLSGKKPFSGKSHEEVCLKSSTANFSFPTAIFKDASEDAISLTKSLLQLRPHLRLTAQAALCHQWFDSDNSKLPQRPPNAPRNYLRLFRIAIYAVMFTQSWCEDIDNVDNGLCSPNSMILPPLEVRHPTFSSMRRILSGGNTPNRRIGSLRKTDTNASLRTSRRLSVLSDATSSVLELGGRNTAVAE